jgi:hypothetical protein
MRDGKIISDHPVEKRLNAVEELNKLRSAQEAVQLIP